jgi:hypothetical protein
MEAKDLRIGNLVNYKIVDKLDSRKEWYEVSKIDIDDLRVLQVKDEMNQDYEPIPLTEEWLLKFGFEKVIYESDETGYNNDYELDIKGVGLISYSDDFSCALFGSKESSKDELGFLPNWDNCKHVHQFQNLYFALTGQELTLNN